MTINIKTKLQRKSNGINPEDAITFFRELENNKISVGIHSDAGQDNVKKMLWNEFGTNHILKYNSVAIENVGLKPLNKSNFDKGEHVSAGADISIPARPVIRMYLYPEMLDNIEYNYQNDIDLAKKSKLKQPLASANKVQVQLGQKCVVLQRQKMSMGDFAPVNTKGKDINNNSPLTQKIKGFNQPYIQTGELISKIDYKVTNK